MNPHRYRNSLQNKDTTQRFSLSLLIVRINQENDMEGPKLRFDDLPEACVSTILSLTSPQDACRFSLVSSTLQPAADSDLTWQKFIPSDYLDIVSSSTTPLQFSSKKELFHRLCDDVLIDGGRKSFKLDKSFGKKSYVLSSRDISITWSNEPLYWSWISLPKSRFSEVAILRTMSWLEIKGKINTKLLSSNTKYGAYLLMKISDRSYGLDLMLSETSVEVGTQVVSKGTALLRQNGQNSTMKEQMQRLFYGNRTQILKSRLNINEENDQQVPTEREDGWLEIELGEFFINGDHKDEEVKMSLMEVKGQHLKGGLIIEGIEIRPKH